MALPYTRAEIKDRARSDWIGLCNVTLPSFNDDFSALDEDGMVACNPRDREAAHRAEVGDIAVAVADSDAITCRRCLAALHRAPPDRRSPV